MGSDCTSSWSLLSCYKKFYCGIPLAFHITILDWFSNFNVFRDVLYQYVTTKRKKSVSWD